MGRTKPTLPPSMSPEGAMVCIVSRFKHFCAGHCKMPLVAARNQYVASTELICIQSFTCGTSSTAYQIRDAQVTACCNGILLPWLNSSEWQVFLGFKDIGQSMQCLSSSVTRNPWQPLLTQGRSICTHNTLSASDSSCFNGADPPKTTYTEGLMPS